MGKWLYDILKEGSLQDNQVYFAKNGLFKNYFWSTFDLFKSKGKGQREHHRAWNDEGNNLAFFHSIKRRYKCPGSQLRMFN